MNRLCAWLVLRRNVSRWETSILAARTGFPYSVYQARNPILNSLLLNQSYNLHLLPPAALYVHLYSLLRVLHPLPSAAPQSALTSKPPQPRHLQHHALSPLITCSFIQHLTAYSMHADKPPYSYAPVKGIMIFVPFSFLPEKLSF